LKVFAVLFFLMLFALGVGSATSLAGGAVTIICDKWPKLPKWKAGIPVCLFGFFAGLLYITPVIN
jgi:solute carrier family 6 amino acid transporter-like protein 5/7/9/14